MTSHAPRIGVAISAFRSDPPVIRLIDRIVAEQWPVERIVVVDSLGSGAIFSHITASGLEGRVHYHNALVNLGSAGNLQKRLELGATLGLDFVLALNHDAVVSREVVAELLARTGDGRIGALYPLRYRSGKRTFDLTGVSEFSFRVHGTPDIPSEPLVDVYWSSSNGALYSTAPLREHGLRPDGALWMGWEDYQYGLQLHQLGYRQCIVTAARTVDEYEYRTVRVGATAVALHDKPAWTLYYSVRNLLAINVYRLPSTPRAIRTLLWAGLMLVHVWGRRTPSSSVQAFTAYVCGLRDGLLNRRGKWRHPAVGQVTP